MKRDRDKRHRAGRRGGFTLAETLMVVAIILILGGVIFINVLRYMRSMAQLERDGIAKEIFVAAQNHLTMAESQGYLGKSDYGSEETESGKETGIYYFVVNGSESFNGSRVLDLMLPFASVDETVRLGGSYIVRYQADPALVLDVFYCARTGTRFGHTLSDADYTGSDRYLRETVGPENKAKRRTWGSDRAVLGWYGGEEAQNLERGQELKAPEVEVINADKLLVRVKNTNSSNNQASLRLILTGEASGKQAAFTLTFDNTDTNVRHDVLEDTYTVILDDITNDSRQGYDLHFHALFPDFLPGENLLIRAVAFSNQVLTNIAYSGEKKTNSLFADIRYSDSGQAGSGTGDGSSGAGVDGSGSGSSGTGVDGSGTGSSGTGGSSQTGSAVTGTGLTARVASLRHLENLSDVVSGVNAEGAALQVAAAVQTTDLDWDAFRTAIAADSDSTYEKERVRVYRTGQPGEGTEPGCYLPASPSYALSYDGRGHTIANVKTDHSGDAGLFGALPAGSSVTDLLLTGFDIRSQGGSAGCLAGSMTGTDVTNVLTHGKEASVRVTAGTGSAGGLTGSMTGGSVTACGAAVYVKSGSGDAGGLVGTAQTGSDGNPQIRGSYAAGHTEEGTGLYRTDAAEADVVSAGGAAGGLIGSAGNARIQSSYSTCSVFGAAAAGGFAGQASGNLSDCYAAGLVNGRKNRDTGYGGSGDGGSGSSGGTGSSGGAGSTGSPEVLVYVDTASGSFAGRFSGTASGCSYLECINDIVNDQGIFYLSAAGGRASADGISPFDRDLETFRTFTGEERESAGAYDNLLIRYYDGKYSFRTVTQLDETLDPQRQYFVDTHYGDWPAPEILFENVPSGT